MKKIIIVLMTLLVLFGCQKKEDEPTVIEEKVITLWTDWKLDSVKIDEEAYKEEMTELTDEEFKQKMEEFNNVVSVESSSIKEITLNEDGTFVSDYMTGSFQIYNNQITLNGTVYDEAIMITLTYVLDESGLTLISDKEIYHYVEKV